ASGSCVNILRSPCTREAATRKTRPATAASSGAIEQQQALKSGTSPQGRRDRRLTAEYVAARPLAESATLSEAVQRVLQAICEALDWDFGAFWNVDGGRGVLRCAETWHAPTVRTPEFEEVSRSTTFTKEVGLPGRVWATGKPAWIHDVVDD